MVSAGNAVPREGDRAGLTRMGLGNGFPYISGRFRARYQAWIERMR
jgi:hypothetical protein